MTDIKHTSDLVKALLEQDERCRNSDSFLYLRALSVVADRKNIDLKKVTIPQFLIDLHGTELPYFETVRRARQKVQEHHPELCACEQVQEFRAENEAEYRAYARCEV